MDLNVPKIAIFKNPTFFWDTLYITDKGDKITALVGFGEADDTQFWAY